MSFLNMCGSSEGEEGGGVKVEFRMRIILNKLLFIDEKII